MMDVISDNDVVEILYEFIKTKIMIMDLSALSPNDTRFQRFEKTVREIQQEIKNNKNKDDIKIVKLDQLLQEIFQKLAISDLLDLDSITDELLDALKQARNINIENNRLSELYGGNYAFVKTYQDASENFNLDKSEIEKILVVVYEDIKNVITAESLIIQGRNNFIASIKHNITKQLLKEKLYSKVKIYYDKLLSELFTNIQLFK